MANANVTVTQLPPKGPAMEPSETELAALKQKYGDDIYYLRVKDVACVVRLPREGEYDRFETVQQRGQHAMAMKELLAICTVWSSEPMDQVWARRPLYGKKLFMGMAEWAAAGDQIEKKEL